MNHVQASTHGRKKLTTRLLEGSSNIIFRWRLPLLILFTMVTVVLGASATQLKMEAGFAKMLPLDHPYIKTFLKYGNEFGGANKILVELKSEHGTIYQKPFMHTLKEVTNAVFYVNGVERSSVTSLFTPNVRYTEVALDGFRGGNIVNAGFQGTPEQLAQVRINVLKSNWIGRIVAPDMSAAMVVATLQDKDPKTGGALDLQEVGHQLEAIRAKYQNDDISIHITGFAKSISDIADGTRDVMTFFVIAFVITALLLLWYSGSFMLSAWALICAMVPVVWLLGILPLLGMALDPMSILVPFLIFAIGVSHAVQMTNAWKLETLHGHDGVTASRNCFRKLFVPGATALIANALGFMVIAFVHIEMVHDLALTATIGVLLMTITNKMLLPILLSYMRFSPAQAERLRNQGDAGLALWQRLGNIATRRGSLAAIAIGIILLGLGLWKASELKIGDLGRGVPELRADSRYNLDVAAITRDFAIGVDVLQVIAKITPKTAEDESPCVDRKVMDKVAAFEFAMRQDANVASVRGLAGYARATTQKYSEGALVMRMLPETTAQLAQSIAPATRLGGEYMDSHCSALPISIYPVDHQATTIAAIVERIQAFKQVHDNERLSFQLATGNVGVMAATNEAVEAADKWVNLALFAAVGLLCLLIFRSWRITLCIIIPLAIVTVLCNALMAALGIGVKVNTLPVVALGVGVGVDYGIYLFERIKHEAHERNLGLREAFIEALKQRGTASVFTAVTMTLSVATWAFASLKFQADMGILLAFMFLVNLFGAVLLTPAIAAWLVGDRLRPGQQH